MNKFESHYTETLEPIEILGVTFHVKLPTKENKRFQRAVASELYTFADDGTHEMLKVTPGRMVEIQVDSFVQTCIRKVEGWDEFTVDRLLAMPDACEDLWEKVSALTNAREVEAKAEVKKPQSLSSGPSDGQASGTSITDSLKAAG